MYLVQLAYIPIYHLCIYLKRAFIIIECRTLQEQEVLLISIIATRACSANYMRRQTT